MDASVDLRTPRSKNDTAMLQKMTDVWQQILRDDDGRRALESLKRAGFPVLHLSPRDPTFRKPCWADYIAGIPLVPYQASRRRMYMKGSSLASSSITRQLRSLSDDLRDPFCDVSIRITKDIPPSNISGVVQQLIETADFIDEFSKWRWTTRHRNPRNALIAELRWTIRHRTGRPHDAELSALIDAAFRAAGVKNGCYIDASVLDRIEKREKESRVKATARFRFRTEVSRS
jgi:hypothetical protein